MNKFSLNDLNFDNIGQWPRLAKYLFITIVTASLIGLGYWFLIKPTLQQTDILVAQEKTLRLSFERKQQMAANLQRYKDQLEVMNARFGAMLKQLPSQNEMPGLLDDISKTGIASGLVFESFAPQPEVMHDFYIELPIEIIVLGNYHQFAVFLSRVVEMNRIVTLHDFEITVINKGKQAASGDILEMKIMAKIYRYKAQ
jgi:type IV pilus assembly protein PilO